MSPLCGLLTASMTWMVYTCAGVTISQRWFDPRRIKKFIDGGCAHFQGPVHASIYGDHATAVSYSLLILHKQNEFEVERATAHHWQFERVESEWKVRKRTSRALNGDGYARKLLAAGVKKSAESETDSEQSTPQP